MKTTVFTKHHIANGAKMAEFAGYNMPIEFTGINEEHLAHKYAEGGYLRLWIPESDNALRLARLRELIRNRQELRRLFDEIFDREMAANG